VRHSALLMTSPADLIVISDSFDGGNINRLKMLALGSRKSKSKPGVAGSKVL